MNVPSNESIPRRLRWKPLAALLLAVLAAWIYVWRFWDTQRQDKVFRSGLLIICSGLGFFLWLMFFSGLPWKRRFQGAGLLILMIAGLAATFRLTEVTGDLVPVFEPRWRHAPTARSAATPAPPAAAPAVTNTYWFPQYLGPNRDGKLAGVQIETNWTAHPPQQVWRQPIGGAWSGFAVAGSHAITTEQRGDDEVIACYDLGSGLPVWENRHSARYATTIGGEGPRVTPTLSTNRVYAMGGSGVTTCINLSDGKSVWSRNLFQENGLRVPDWGVVSAPLLVSNLVIVTVGAGPGKSLYALDAETGSTRWSGGDDGASYSSPVLLDVAGQPQILIFNDPGVAAHDPGTGSVLWTYPWKNKYPKITFPTAVGASGVLLTSGYGAGSELLDVSRTNGQWQPKSVWKTIRLKSKFGNLLVWRGYIYGLDDGILTCLNPQTGESLWKDGRYGHAQMLLVNELLLITTETGDLVLVEPKTEGLSELARIHVFDDKTWNPPAVAGPYLLMRNHREAACYKLPVRS